MTQLTHGGDWAGYRAQYGHDALDFSANVSPLGLPQGVANAIAAALPHADRYPDPLCRALRAKLAPHEGIPAESILCGNGAADLIFRLAWAAKPRTALVTAPTFAEYAAALESAGCAVRRHFLQAEVDFAVTDSILSSITPEVDMVFLCQPNDPTGQLARLPPCGAHPAPVRSLRGTAGGGRMFSGFSARLRRPDRQSPAGQQKSADPQGLYQAVRHGRGAAGVLPVCQHGPAGSHAGRRAAVGGVQSGAGRRACRTGRNGLCGTGAGTHCAAAAPAGLRALGVPWTDAQSTCCSRADWAMPCGSGAARLGPGWTALTAPPCVYRAGKR